MDVYETENDWRRVHQGGRLYLEEILGSLKIAPAMHGIHSVYWRTFVRAPETGIFGLHKSIIWGRTCPADAIKSVTSPRTLC